MLRIGYFVLISHHFPSQDHWEAALGLPQSSPLKATCPARLFLLQQPPGSMQTEKWHPSFPLIAASLLALTLGKLIDLNIKHYQNLQVYLIEKKRLSGKRCQSCYNYSWLLFISCFYIFCYAVKSSFQAYKPIKKSLINSPRSRKFLGY